MVPTRSSTPRVPVYNLFEFNDQKNQYDATTVSPPSGGGQLSKTEVDTRGRYFLNTSWVNNPYIRFFSLKSNAVKDRSELSFYDGLQPGKTYYYSFDLKLPPLNYKNYYNYPDLNDWFIITQVKQKSAPDLVPFLSLNLEYVNGKKVINVVGRRYKSYRNYIQNGNAQQLEAFQRSTSVLRTTLISYGLETPSESRFKFNQWHHFELRFRTGKNGYLELWAETYSKSGRLTKIGEARYDFLHNIENSSSYLGDEAWMKLGLYRGSNVSNKMRSGYIVDFDNLEFRVQDD